MKKKIAGMIGVIALLCVAFVVYGASKAAQLQKINDAGLTLVADTTDTGDFQAKLYEMAYSSPVAPEKIGLWLEAVLTKKFETFSCDSKPVPEGLVSVLKGWPLTKTMEIDLSFSGATDETIAKLGSFPAADWIDLSGTKVTNKTLKSIANGSPNLRKLEIKNTAVTVDKDLAAALLKLKFLQEVVYDGGTADQAVLNRLREGLSAR